MLSWSDHILHGAGCTLQPLQACSYCCKNSAQVVCHRANTEVLAAVHDIAKAGEGGTTEYWWWKALTQLRDLIIYHAEDTEALNALDALLTGEAFHPEHCTQNDCCHYILR